jgi:branched-chain amino acid transport system ATP-binding protein
MLLIEHKLDLVMAVADRVVALDAGEVLVSGRPEIVRSDPRLVEAYVGRRGAGHSVPDSAVTLQKQA